MALALGPVALGPVALGPGPCGPGPWALWPWPWALALGLDDDDDDSHPGYPIPPIPSHPGKKHGVRPKILT